VKDFRSIAQQLIRSLRGLFIAHWRRSNNPEKWIEEFELLSGLGHSRNQRFNRYEAHQR
jgi:hypothetical protein